MWSEILALVELKLDMLYTYTGMKKIGLLILVSFALGAVIAFDAFPMASGGDLASREDFLPKTNRLYGTLTSTAENRLVVGVSSRVGDASRNFEFQTSLETTYGIGTYKPATGIYDRYTQERVTVADIPVGSPIELWWTQRDDGTFYARHIETYTHSQ